MNNTGNITRNYFNYTIELNLNQQYFWRVMVNDSLNVSPWSNIWNFTVQPYVAVSLLTANVNFGTIFQYVTQDTTDGIPNPLRLQNDGNTECNVSVSARSLWKSIPLNRKYYRFKAREALELNGFNLTHSQMTWENMSSGNRSAIKKFYHTDSHDEEYIDIQVEVPPYEAPGLRNSTIIIYSEEGT